MTGGPYISLKSLRNSAALAAAEKAAVLWCPYLSQMYFYSGRDCYVFFSCHQLSDEACCLPEAVDHSICNTMALSMTAVS